MYVNNLILATNPFFEAYTQSDLLGKLIFLSLYALSFCTWFILIHKIWLTHQAKKYAWRFHEIFQMQRQNPLGLDYENLAKKKHINPFFDLYKVLKKHSLEVLAKNKHFKSGQSEDPHVASLSLSDIDFVASHLSTQVSMEVKNLEKNLYVLSTIASLAPFLGLLGTVWGILTSFAEMQTHAGGNSHQLVLNGLSLALATTVLGLIDAIPALIGYNYLKNNIHGFSTDMEGFSNEILGAVELQYRKVET